MTNRKTTNALGLAFTPRHEAALRARVEARALDNPNNLPTEPPAIGGWFWNEKQQKANFLMPPYPGVDDCVQTPDGWAYRSLVEEQNRNALNLTATDFDYNWRADTNEYPFDTVYFVDVDAVIDGLENEFLNDDYQPYINPLDYETALEFPCDHCGSTNMTARGFQKGRKGHNGEWTYRCFSICLNCGDVFEF